MGLLGSIRGTDRTPDQEQAIPSLEATLPDGWKVTDFPKQLVGRRPVKHETCGAPPPITPTDQRFRAPWAPLTATAEEDAARASAVALLPEGAVVSPTDEERFGALTVSGDRHLPDQTGIAASGPDPAGAYQALAARLRGELAVSEVWFSET